MTSQQWALIADDTCGRLLKVERTATNRTHVTEMDSIQHTNDAHQHVRPSPLNQKNGHTYASWPHESETSRTRFAKELCVWAEQQADVCGIERLAVFAPDRFLGALRDAWTPRFAIMTQEHHCELAQLGTNDLARHNAIASLVTEAKI